MAFLGINYRGIIGSGAALGFGGIRLPSSSYQPEAAAFFTAIEDAGGTLSDNVKAEWDNVVLSLKNENLYSRFLFITPKLGGKAESAVLDATGNLTPRNVNFTDADADPLIGLKGDGSTKKIDYRIAANAMLSNFNWAIGVQYITQPVADKYTLGAYNSASEVVNLRFGTTNSYIYGQSLSISDAQTTLVTYPQIHIGSRTSQTSLKLYVNGSGAATTTTSDTGTIPATNFAEYGLGLLLPEDSKHGIAFATDGLNDAEALTISTIFTTFLTNIEIAANGWWDGSQTGLLDDYPSASAAYSVRALNSAYTGALLRVRRSSDNAEQDIYAMANGDLDTASLLTFVGAGDGFVVTWYDQSGNGLNATNATAANQPQIVASGVLITDGSQPSLYFDGNNDQLNAPVVFSGTELSQIFVTNIANPQSKHNAHLINGNTTNYANRLAVISSTTLSWYSSGAGASSVAIESPYTYRNTQSLISIYAQNGDGYNVSAYKNLDPVVNLNNPNYSIGSHTSITIGNWSVSGGEFTGKMSELIYYPINKESDQIGLRSNINSHYSIF